jgi:hypothetical protein
VIAVVLLAFLFDQKRGQEKTPSVDGVQ